MTHCWPGAAWLLFLLAGCVQQQPATPSTTSDELLFTGSPQELVPHHDGDHFVYFASGAGGDERLQVEHISAPESASELIADLSEDGVAIGKTHLRDDGTSLAIVSESLLQHDMMIVYADPLPSLTLPLRSSPQRATSPVTLTRLSDGAVLATGRVEQIITAHRGSPEAGTDVFEIDTERTVTLPNRAMRLDATTWITPGIGEVRSEGRTDGGPLMRRELICAIISGKRVGDCARLMRKIGKE